MAETDLIIRAKIEGDNLSKEKLETLKKGLEGLEGGRSKEDFEKIFRHTGNIERQLRELTVGITSGSPFKAVVNFAATFGVIGVAAKAAYDTIAGIANAVTTTMKGLSDLQFEAAGMGIHPAQLQREIEQGRVANIPRETIVSM